MNTWKKTTGVALGLVLLIWIWDRLVTPTDNPEALKAPLALAKVAISSDLESARHTAIVKAVQTVSPAVVSITVTQRKIVRYGDPTFDDPFFSLFAPRYRRQEVSSIGSGVILDAKGHVVSNSHVVAGGGAEVVSIMVTLPDGRQMEASLVGHDPNNDLAVLKVAGGGLPVAPIQDKPDNVIGEWVIAIGNPYGYLMGDHQPTVTVGVISALNRTFLPQSGIPYHHMIQTDASINPGNSGGALVNALGEVIGINTFIFSGDNRAPGSIGLGFAIPIQKALLVVKELITYGYIREFTTGIYTDPSLDRVMGRQGIVVAGLDKGSPGEKAGLQAGDVIVAVEGREVRNIQDAQEIFKLFQVGEDVALDYLRDGKRRKTKMVLEEKPRSRQPSAQMRR